MNTNYSEQIFESIDTIISQRLNEVSFDKTEICEIVDVDKNDKHKYRVSNGALKFDAYSDDTSKTYSKGSKVYVRITNGDYNLNKAITGSYTADQNNKNSYVNPFHQLTIGSTKTIEKKLTIRTHTKTDGPMSEDNAELQVNFNYSSKYHYIGLEFGLDTTALSNTYTGQYTIEVELLDNEKNRLLKEEQRLILFNTDLYGNPYSLIPELKLQHLFPFPEELDITKVKYIKIWFAEQGGFEKAVQISLQDLKLYFGYETSEITKDNLNLAIQQGQALRYTTGDNEIATARTLYLEWQFIDSENNAYIFNSEQSPTIFDEYNIYWLHYVGGSGSGTDELPDDYDWNWQVIDANTDFSCNINLTTQYNNDQYKAVIKYIKDAQEYYSVSNSIIFENTQVMAEPGATNNSEDTLRIKLNENDTGVYNVYGFDGRMMDNSYKGPHYIHFEFLDATPLDKIAKVKWDFPTTATMIITTEKERITQEQYTTFNIDTMYKPGAMNNRIWCTVTLINGEVRRGSLTLQFGEASAAGSNYAFNIDFEGHRTCIWAKDSINDKDDQIKINATFVKQNGEVMTVPSITWSWKDSAARKSSGGIELLSTTGSSVEIKYSEQTIPNNNYSILQAVIKDYPIDNGLKADLTAYLPIPIAKKAYHYISGATRVVYDSNGNSATYSQNPYKLYDLDSNKIENTSWFITPDPADTNIKNDVFQLKTQNIYDENGNKIGEEKTLLPLSYMPQVPPSTCVYCKKDNKVVWSQPILIMQNRWEYDLLNSWNGKLQSDNTNYVLAPLLGAGKKENNAFTGVMMGDLKIANNSTSQTGLYGFKEGSRRFSFNDKGEAYIGTSNNYIQLDDTALIINVQNFDLAANDLTLSSKDNGYFYIGNDDSFLLFNNGLSIQTDTFNLYTNTIEINSSENGYFSLGNGDDSYFIFDGSSISMASKDFELRAGNLLLTSKWEQIEVKDASNNIVMEIGKLFSWGYGGQYGIAIKNGTFVLLDKKGEKKVWFEANSNIVYLDGRLTNSEHSDSYLTIGVNEAGNPGVFYNHENESYFSIWPSSNNDCVISGKNGIIITNTKSNGTIAKFSNSNSGIYSDQIDLMNSENTNTCLVKIRGGLKASYYDSSDKKWYYNLEVNRTSSGGHLYGTWVIGKINLGTDTEPYLQLYQSSWKDSPNTKLGVICAPVEGYLKGTWSVDNPKDTWSDRNKKNSIISIKDNYELLFDNLYPVLFKYNEGTSGRLHMGFIAQEVQQALNMANISSQDFAGLVIHERNTNNEVWGLRYEEFIPLNTWQIQKLKVRVAELENEIKEIKQRYEI